MSSGAETSGGDGATNWSVASLRRTCDEMREHIMRLKAEVEQEKNNVKRLEREKTMAVKKVRDEEESLRKQSMDDLKNRLAREHKERMQALKDACADEYETESRRVVRECEEKLRASRMQWEAEKSEEIEHVRKTCSRKAREEADAVLGLEKKKLTQELFEMSDCKAKAEQRVKELHVADKAKAEDIRRLHDEHQSEIARQKKAAHQENRRMLDELHEKKEQLSRKERELVDAKRKKAQVEMEKETLEDTLTRMREADSWQRMSPRAPVLGIGDISLDSATSPMRKQYGEREKQLIQRNSELSLLARRLEENLSAMTAEKESLDTQAQEAKLANKPLQDKAEDYMKKYNSLIAKHRVLETHSKQTDEVYHKLMRDHDRMAEEFDAYRKKTRRSMGQSLLADKQKKELETLREQNSEYHRAITDLKQTLADKDRRLKQALAAKRSLLKKQAALAAEVASSPSRGLSASQSYSVLPTAGAASGEVAESTSLMPHSQSLNILSRTSSMESLASALQDEAEQAAFDRDELETDFRQLEKEHMHLQRVFALHFQRTLSDTERIEYEQLTAEYEQQVEKVASLETDLYAAVEKVAKTEKVVAATQEAAHQFSESSQMATEEISTMRAKISHLQSENAVLSDTLSKAYTLVEEGSTSHGKLEEDLEQSRNTVLALEEQLEIVKIAASHQEEAKQDSLQTAQEELESSLERANNLEVAVQDLQFSVEGKEEELMTLEAHMQDLMSAKVSAEEGAIALTSQVQQLQAELVDAQDQDMKMQEKVKKVEHEASELQEQIRDLRVAGSAANETIVEQMEKDFAKKEEKLNVALKLKEEEVSKLTETLLMAEEARETQKCLLQDAVADKKATEQKFSDELHSAEGKVKELSDAMAGGLTSQVALLVEEHNSIADIVSTLLQALSDNNQAQVRQSIADLHRLISENPQLEEAAGFVKTVELLTGRKMPSLQKSFRSALEKQRASALTTPPSLLSPKSDSEADGDPAKGGMALAVVQDMLKTRTDELEDVQQQLQTRDEEHITAVRQLEETQQDCAVLKSQCQRLTARLDTAQSEVTRLETVEMKLQSLQGLNATLENECEVLTKKVSVSSRPTIAPEQAEMLAQAESYKSQVSELSLQAEGLTRTNEALNSELLLLWRLVSLELKLADKTGIGAGSVSAKLRELEKSLQDHSQVEEVVAQIMEERSRLHSDGSASMGPSGIPSFQRRLSELSDECRGKDDKICQLEAEIAQLTSKLSVNIISNLSSSNLSESMSQSLSQYASPTGTMRREHAIPGRTAPVKRQMEANKRKDSTGSISSDVASPRHQVSRAQYRDTLQTTQGQHQPLHHRLSQDAAPMSPAHKLTSLSSAFGATNTDSLVSSSGRGTPPAATSSQQAVSSPFAGRMPSVVTSSSEYQHESSLTTQPGTPQSAARSSAVAQAFNPRLSSPPSSPHIRPKASQRSSLASQAKQSFATSSYPEGGEHESRSSRSRSPPDQHSVDGNVLPPAPPQSVHFERQYGNSLLLAWTRPPLLNGRFSNGSEVFGYRVAIDKLVIEDVPGPHKTRILLENVDLNRMRRVSVATITTEGFTSVYTHASVYSVDDRSTTPPLPPREAPGLPYTDSLEELDFAPHTGGARSPPMLISDLHPLRSQRHQHKQQQVLHEEGPYSATCLVSFTPSTSSPGGLLRLVQGSTIEVLIDDPTKPYVVARRGHLEGLVERRNIERLPNIVPSDSAPKPAIALYDYKPDSIETPADSNLRELTFQEGDTMLVYGREDSRGYVQVKLRGHHGLVPVTFVEYTDGQDDMATTRQASQGMAAGAAKASFPVPAIQIEQGLAEASSLGNISEEGSIGSVSVSSYASSEFNLLTKDGGRGRRSSAVPQEPSQSPAKPVSTDERPVVTAEASDASPLRTPVTRQPEAGRELESPQERHVQRIPIKRHTSSGESIFKRNRSSSKSSKNSASSDVTDSRQQNPAKTQEFASSAPATLSPKSAGMKSKKPTPSRRSIHQRTPKSTDI